MNNKIASMILIRGLPGAGKSTLAKIIARKENTIHLEADMYFINDNGDYEFDPKKIGSAHDWCQRNTESNLRADISVVVANTFTTTRELKPYFDIAKELGIVPSIILLQNNFGSIHNVPEGTIKGMKSRFAYDISSLM